MSEHAPALDVEQVDPLDEPRARPAGRWRARLGSVELLAVVVLLALLLRGSLVDLFSSPGASMFVTVLVSVAVAGLPFVVLGAAASAALAAFVPRRHLERLPAVPRPAAVPAAAAAGLVAPLGDDALPASAGLARRSPAVAVTFLLASSAVNPVVLVATAVAFPGEPMMVLGRLLAGLLAAVAVGGLWLWLGGRQWLTPPLAGVGDPRAGDVGVGPHPWWQPDTVRGWPLFWERCRLDVLRAGGFLVLGALTTAVLTVALPARWLDAIGGSGLFAIVAMALLAVLLSVRGGADAFVAAALSRFPATARLAFMVVGPIANLRLFSREVAMFGPRFALRLAPAALGVGLLCAALVGTVLL